MSDISEEIPQETQDTGSICISNQTVNYLKEASPWLGFFAVLSVIGTVFILIAAVCLLIMYGVTRAHDLGGIMSPYNIAYPLSADITDSEPMLLILGSLYLITGGIMIIPTLFLFRCSKALKAFSKTVEPEHLEISAKNMKSLLKFYGIFVIVSWSLCIWVTIIVTLVAVF